MFIGHFAVGFALKRVAPRTSLGVLIAAPQALDLLWPWFLLLGWERVHIVPDASPFLRLAFDSYPISHSLATSIVWGMLFGGVYLLIRPKDALRSGPVQGGDVTSAPPRGGHDGRLIVPLWIALAVVSHWVLDWITHRPDLPIVPGYPLKVGLGLWRSVPATIIVESAMFAAGVLIYARATRARDRMGRLNFWVYVAVLAAMYGGSIVGPPPPDPRSLAVVGLAIWLLPPWAAWFDRHREATPIIGRQV